MSALEEAFRSNDSDGVSGIQRVLDHHVLFEVRINPEGRISVARGQAKAELLEQGWRTFLIKVNNEAGITSPFTVRSEEAEPMGCPSSLAITGVHDFTNGAVDNVLAQNRWLALDNWSKPPLEPHANPVFIIVNGEPVRASRKSAQWCRTGVDACWKQKSKRIRPSEMADAAAAFDHARKTYDRIISECKADS